MTIKVGDKIPTVELNQMTDSGVEAISSDQIFANQRVVLFALPGAFTPTCSAKHLPGFTENADKLSAKGIDRIVCLSVNDAYVMDAWGKQQNVEDKVMMVADGSGHFTSAMGLDLDLSARGMGTRSQRYAMVVNDGVIELLNVEAAGEFRVSDVDSILASL